MIEITTKYFRWVGRGAILRPGWRWRRQRALPHIQVSLVDIEQIIQVRLNQTLSVIFVSSDRSSYSDSVLLLVQASNFFQSLSIYANIAIMNDVL